MASTRLLTPGPGQYNSNLNDKTKSPSYRIGSAKRNTGNRNDFPKVRIILLLIYKHKL